jgi:nitrite reductase/ring-hydroxylating ferredoxin subunit
MCESDQYAEFEVTMRSIIQRIATGPELREDGLLVANTGGSVYAVDDTCSHEDV